MNYLKKISILVLICICLTGFNNTATYLQPSERHLKSNSIKEDSIPCFVNFNVSKHYTHTVDLTYGSECNVQHKKDNESSDFTYQLNNYKTIGTSFQATGFAVEVNTDGPGKVPITGNATLSRTMNNTMGCCPSGNTLEKVKTNGSAAITANDDEGQLFFMQYDFDSKQGNCGFTVHSVTGVSYNSTATTIDCQGNSNESDLSSQGAVIMQGITLAGVQLNNADNPMNDALEQMGIGGKCDFNKTEEGYIIGFNSSHTTHNPLMEGWTGTDDIEYQLKVNVIISFHQKYTAYIEPDGGWEKYKQWLPEGNIKDETRKPGNTTSFKVKMVDNDHPNETADVQIKDVIYTLQEVSTVPGVCNNYPTKDPDLKSDLSFIDPDNENNDELLELKFHDLNPAKINSYDFGGSGQITAKITLKSGEEITAESSDDHKKYVNIPYRKDDSKVSDDWKKQKNASDLADNDDNEKSETGVGEQYPGDGYTLYEEYRGFRENEKHIRTSPKERDIMVYDKSAAKDRTQNGITLFSTVSGIITHSHFKEEEFGKKEEEPGQKDLASSKYKTTGIDYNKIMNFNNYAPLHSVDQYGLLILSSPLKLGYAKAVKKDKSPATPKGFYFLVITEDFKPDTLNDSGYAYIRGDMDSTGKITINPNGTAKIITDEYGVTVAHEMFHCCHVMHHGDKDYSGGKLYVKDGVIMLSTDQTGEKPVTLRINNAAGTEVLPTNKAFWDAVGNNLSIEAVGVYGGQHSGVEDCIMRYDNANAFLSKDEGTVYMFVDNFDKDLNYKPKMWMNELTGITLCDTKKGSGVNLENASPRCRYGDATMGNCKSQVCINDKYN